MNKNYLYLLLTLLLTWSNVALGQTPFDPNPPAEPNTPDEKGKVVVLASPRFGGSVSGGGTYIVGRSVTLSASPATGFTFVNWTDDHGNVVSTERSYTFDKASGTESYNANFEFNPSGPGEPSDPTALLYYNLTVKGATGGTASGGGRYRAGTSVYLYATAKDGFAFAYWKNEAGEMLSQNASFYYTTQAKHETVTAVFTYEPDAPSEPNVPILRHNVVVKGTLGVSVNGGGRALQGTTQQISCNVNPGYKFLYWLKDGEEYTSLESFSYTVEDKDVEFYAVAEFDPVAPAEPPMADFDSYSFYLMTVNGVPGSTVTYGIYLNNAKVVKDMNIRLTFPPYYEVVAEDYVLSDKAEGYTVSIGEAVDEISMIEEGSRLWNFSMIGGEVQPGTQALLTFKVTIPEDAPTGMSKQVKINQISMTQEDGSTVTAHTRNGRIGVYKRGDANGDDIINIKDVVGVVSIINNVEDDSLIEVAADANEDVIINVKDIVGIIEIINE